MSLSRSPPAGSKAGLPQALGSWCSDPTFNGAEQAGLELRRGGLIRTARGLAGCVLLDSAADPHHLLCRNSILVFAMSSDYEISDDENYSYEEEDDEMDVEDYDDGAHNPDTRPYSITLGLLIHMICAQALLPKLR